MRRIECVPIYASRPVPVLHDPSKIFNLGLPPFEPATALQTCRCQHGPGFLLNWSTKA